MCMGFIQGAGGLFALRLLLGLFEGCLFPAMTLFLANWYKREELGLRVSYLFSKLMFTNSELKRGFTKDDQSDLHSRER